MIKIYPVKIEAYDKDKDVMLFSMESIDKHVANVDLTTTISPSNIDELVAAMRSAVQMLELE